MTTTSSAGSTVSSACRFYGDSVWSLTLPRIPVTLELIGYATVLAVAITLPLATIAALRRGGTVDHGIRLLGTTALGSRRSGSGLILALYLGVKVKLFPVTGRAREASTPCTT